MCHGHCHCVMVIVFSIQYSISPSNIQSVRHSYSMYMYMYINYTNNDSVSHVVLLLSALTSSLGSLSRTLSYKKMGREWGERVKELKSCRETGEFHVAELL